MTTNIWQVAAGDGERDYSDVFLQFGVMLIGPGTKSGDYRKHKNKYKDHRPLRQFADDADNDDLVVLKGGKKGRKWEVLAVGRIKSEYSFEAVFGDVEGFQLQHCRQVEWRLPTGEKYIRLGRGMFSHVNKSCDEVALLWEKGTRKKSEQIPTESVDVSHKALIDSLMAGGLPRQRAEGIADETLRLRELADWYESHDENFDVREHETRTFLIVPLIKSLGWIEQNVKIELDHMDVVLFNGPYSKKNKPVVIIESKRLWHGLGGASDQAERYAEKNPTCDRLIVSDGIRYKLYTKPKPGNKWPLTAYLNLLTPTLKHPYKRGVEGAVSFLLKMKPDAR